MKIKKLNFTITDENLIHTFYKNGYEYKIYSYKDKIMISKEDLKTEKFEIQSFEII